METLSVPLVTLPHFDDLPLPAHATEGSAGVDLRAAVTEPIQLEPMARRGVPTGIKIAVPVGYEAQVRPRSGLALKHGIGIINSPGTIDSDYRGEIFVPLINLGETVFIIEKGMRIAQLVIAPIVKISWQPSISLDRSNRNEGGFGHTGLH